MAKNKRRAKVTVTADAPQAGTPETDVVLVPAAALNESVSDETQDPEGDEDTISEEELKLLGDDEVPQGEDAGDTTEVTDTTNEITDAPGSTAKVRKIKDVMYEQIVEKKETNTQVILDAIYLEFPNANSGPKDVSWYRWKFREAGHDIPGGRGGKLTDAEKKARKATYESQRKAKLEADKAKRRETAQQAAVRAEQERIAGLTDRALELIEERGLVPNGDTIRAVVAELMANPDAVSVAVAE
jgi:hypothetical protein